MPSTVIRRPATQGRTRPPWTDAMSDGCSVPAAIQNLFPAIDEACVTCFACCAAHDHAYYDGGSEDQRLIADCALRDCMIPIAGVEMAERFYHAVRLFGGDHWGERKWHGGEFPERLEAP